MPSIETLIDHVSESVAGAWEHRSRLPEETLEVGGRTSPKIRHLLNNLCGLPDTHFLEAGSWKGASFISALAGNEASVIGAVAIDNWCQRGGAPFDGYSDNERAFDESTAKFLSLYDAGCWRKLKQDLFTITELPIVPNVFYYDADHSRTQEGTQHFFGMVADPCVVCIDDWSWPFVQEGWRAACAIAGITVAHEWELPTKRNKDIELWWEGFYVAVIAKGQP